MNNRAQGWLCAELPNREKMWHGGKGGKWSDHDAAVWQHSTIQQNSSFGLLQNDSFIYIFMQKDETGATGGVLLCSRLRA
jgi:hypothetical protein